jgi:hypothetical protein
MRRAIRLVLRQAVAHPRTTVWLGLAAPVFLTNGLVSWGLAALAVLGGAGLVFTYVLERVVAREARWAAERRPLRDGRPTPAGWAGTSLDCDHGLGTGICAGCGARLVPLGELGRSGGQRVFLEVHSPTPHAPDGAQW